MSKSITETEAVIARAYALSILKKLHITLGERDAIYLSPIAQRGIAAGDLVAPEVTNFQIFKLGDSLFSADSPNYTGEPLESYIHRLWRYLPWVDTGADHSQGAEERLNETQSLANSAAQRHNEILVEAQAKFLKAKESDPGLDFWTWVVKNVPEVVDTEKKRQATQVELSLAADVYYGPRASELSKYMDDIKKALSQESSPGLNMPGVIDTKIMSTIVKQASSGKPMLREGWSHAVLQMPFYSIETYAKTVRAWMSESPKGGERNQTLQIDMANGRSTKWEDYGFKEAPGDDKVGLFPLFLFEIKAGDEAEMRTLTIENEDSILIQLSMHGLQEFRITPGAWDVPNVKTLFPKLLPDASEFLDSRKLARATSVIVGYDIELKATFKGNTGEEVNDLYQKARDSGGKMTIFGVKVWTSDGSDDFKTRFEDVHWDRSNSTMTISIRPTQVQPTVLAVLAETLD